MFIPTKDNGKTDTPMGMEFKNIINKTQTFKESSTKGLRLGRDSIFGITDPVNIWVNFIMD
jgi:hypothetical protein